MHILVRSSLLKTAIGSTKCLKKYFSLQIHILQHATLIPPPTPKMSQTPYINVYICIMYIQGLWLRLNLEKYCPHMFWKCYKQGFGSVTFFVSNGHFRPCCLYKQTFPLDSLIFYLVKCAFIPAEIFHLFLFNIP